MPIALLLGAALAACLAACGGGGSAQPSASPEPLRVAFYGVTAAGLAPVDMPSPSDSASVPWPRALRVAGIAGRGSVLYAGINGFGVARFKEGSREPELIGHEAFSSLTLGSMHALKGGLLVLLYRNTAFDGSLGSAPSIILELPLGASGFQDSSIPANADGYHAVYMASVEDGSWAIEYKKAATDRVEWLRKLVKPDGGESQLTESEYRALAESSSRFEIPAGIAASIPSAGLDVTDLDDGRHKHSLAPDPEGEAFVACVAGSRLYVMRGAEVREAGTESIIADAPELPEGFRFTALARSGEYWFASYEEGEWPYFGASGLVFFQ